MSAKSPEASPAPQPPAEVVPRRREVVSGCCECHGKGVIPNGQRENDGDGTSDYEGADKCEECGGSGVARCRECLAEDASSDNDEQLCGACWFDAHTQSVGDSILDEVVP